MKVNHCDYGGVHVTMSKSEFEIITKVVVGDQYGNRGISWGMLQGKEFSLKQLDDEVELIKRIKESYPLINEKIDYAKELLATIHAFGVADKEKKDEV